MNQEPILFQFNSRQHEATPVYPTREAYETARHEMARRLAPKMKANAEARRASIIHSMSHLVG